VWIDHGDGIVTRYAHLSSVADGIREGTRVAQGQEIATVGDSGTPESLSNPGQETHLHWEVRVAESFLGADLAADEVRALYQGLFQPAPR
jgi:murein DD-endopeptidase MepM/ murein hydrolase activator NlpD